jgi:hypothetical protein
MSGKIDFGCDFLNIMRNLELKGKDKSLNPVSDAAASLFLVQWGFSIEEVDKANALFWDKVESKKLENDLTVVAKRIVDHISGDHAAQERLVIQLAALGDMDYDINEEEVSYVKWFEELLDMKPSEFYSLCERGEALAVALNFFGAKYREYAPVN